jgi:hypothetical protein
MKIILTSNIEIASQNNQCDLSMNLFSLLFLEPDIPNAVLSNLIAEVSSNNQAAIRY